jgi:hypothetical protein
MQHELRGKGILTEFGAKARRIDTARKISM